MSHPVGQFPPSYQVRAQQLPKLDLEAIRRAEAIFQHKWDEYRIGSPLHDLGGKPIKGAYKRLLKTDQPQFVALATSPHKTSDPNFFYAAALHDTAMMRRFQRKGHFPVLVDSFDVPGRRLVTIQENLGPNLYEVFLSSANPRRAALDMRELQSITKKLLEATQILHKEGVLHGDIKPENCSRSGTLFDFNLAEEIGIGCSKGEKYSRYYRPPETVVRRMTELSGDVWALGCLFYELFFKNPLIPVGNSKNKLQDDINMLHAYRDRLKLNYDLSKLAKCTPELILKEGEELKLKPSTLQNPLEPLQDQFMKLDKVWRPFADLVEKMLKFSPRERISVEEALSHPFFTSPQLDISFKLRLVGRFSGHMRIKTHTGTLLTSIDLNKLQAHDCIHILPSRQPHILEFFDPANPEEVLHRSQMTVGRDGETITLDADQIFRTA